MERPPEPTMTTLRTSGRGSFGRTLADIRRAISEGELRTRSPSFGAKSPTEGAAIARTTAVGTGRRRVAVRWKGRAEGFARELTTARIVERWMGLNSPIALCEVKEKRATLRTSSSSTYPFSNFHVQQKSRSPPFALQHYI
jgi:hypothetical protein